MASGVDPSKKPGKHREKETPEKGGGRHRAIGEPVPPIKDKRVPGKSVPRSEVVDKARNIKEARDSYDRWS